MFFIALSDKGDKPRTELVILQQVTAIREEVKKDQI